MIVEFTDWRCLTMATVTQRVKEIKSPSRFIAMKDAEVITNAPNDIVYADFVNPSHVGLAVDYLTRLYIDHNVADAFKIPLMGVKILDDQRSEVYKKEIRWAHDDCAKWIVKINPREINNETIIAALNIVKYDAVYRVGWSSSINQSYSQKSVYDKDISAIKELVNRSVAFFKKRKIIKYDFTFDGGYTDLINKGDGDIATEDTLWDIKTFKPASVASIYDKSYGFLNRYSRLKAKHALQVLVYYLLGMHSSYSFYQNIKYIGLYNPVSNRAYRFSIADIPDTVKYQVSHEVIGYKMVTNNPKDWKRVDGTDKDLLKNLREAKIFKLTKFNPDNYKNGIHEITKNDYYTFLINSKFYNDFVNDNTNTITDKNSEEHVYRPSPSLDRSKKIYMLKTDKYKMFVSESYSGKYSLFYGGWIKHLSKSLEWYYQNMDAYGDQVLAIFSEYWDLLYGYSNFLKRIGFSGKVHGNIVDLDFYDHMYVNPLDCTVHAYMATSMEDKHFYQHIENMIANFGNDTLERYLNELEANPPKLLQLSSNKTKLSSLITDEMLQKKKEGTLRKYDLINHIQTNKGTMYYVHSKEMYKGSNSLRALQYVYDNGTIMKWDNLIWDSVHKKLP